MQSGEVIDASTMSIEELCGFYEREISDAKENDIMLSLVRFVIIEFCVIRDFDL